ncbi:MAG: hypothetical protein JXR76_00045 [Deltaproteobacteria bacterium]|nr:hypothetical protein [Deltaproteobacteria bacterium]
MDVKTIVDQARLTPLTRAGISSFASVLTLAESELPHIVSLLCKQSDGHAVAAILLAHAASGKRIPAKIVGATLGLLPSFVEFVAIVGSCEGELVEMFLASV